MEIGVFLWFRNFVLFVMNVLLLFVLVWYRMVSVVNLFFVNCIIVS